MKKYGLFFVLWASLFSASGQATVASGLSNNTQIYLKIHEDWTLQDKQAVFITSKFTTSVKDSTEPKYEYSRVAQNDNNTQNSNNARNQDNRTYLSYTKTNPKTNKVYSGHTSGFGDPNHILKTMDINHHMNAQGFGAAKMDRYSQNKYVIRSRAIQSIKANQAANRHARSNDDVLQ